MPGIFGDPGWALHSFLPVINNEVPAGSQEQLAGGDLPPSALLLGKYFSQGDEYLVY